MIILFGTRRKTANLGRAMHGCPRCNQQSWFNYARTSRHFTLFFIPLIPLGSTTHAVCGSCGFAQTVPTATADQVLAAAQLPQQSPGASFGSTGQPATQAYGQPQQGYGQPQHGYGQPPQGYGQPQQPRQGDLGSASDPPGTPRR